MVFPKMVFGGEVSFVVAPNSIEGDEAVIVDMYVESAGEPINALDGVIGFLGTGGESVTEVIVETGGSPFTLWPQAPVYDKEEDVIRFTGGAITSFEEKRRVLRMRIFTKAKFPITISWLRGEAYRDDGLGTSVNISSRSLLFTPERGEPNIIRATSEDSEPPVIESIEVGYDDEIENGKYFLSVYAIDEVSGFSHFEVIEGGVKTRIDNGPYFFLGQGSNEQVLVTVYDKAGNSVSIKVPEEQKIPHSSFFFLGIIVLTLLIIRRVRIQKSHHT